MIITAFRAQHLQVIELQEAQRYLSADILQPSHAALIEQTGQSFTALAGGRVLACGGCAEIWPGRAVAWMLISKDAGRCLLGIHRAVAGFLSACPHRRIEAWVDEGFEPGMRWLEMLGFVLETPEPMRGFRPDGAACFLFSKVK